MSNYLANAAISLSKRESAPVVSATGLFFQSLNTFSPKMSLKDVVESYKGGTWGEESTSGLGYPILRSSDMRGKKIDVSNVTWCSLPETNVESFAMRSGDILITKSSGSSDLVGKAALFVEPDDGNTYLFSNFTLRLRPDTQKVLPEYLAWFLRSPQSSAWRYETQQTAVGLRNLQTQEFLKQELPVPDKALQQIVVSYLDALDSGTFEIEYLNLPPVLKEQHQIIARIEAIARRVEEAWGLREKAVEETKMFVGRTIAEIFGDPLKATWSDIVLGDITTEVRYGTSEKANDDSDGIPVLRMGNIQNGKLSLSDLKYLHLPKDEVERLKLRDGDILVNRTNSAELVGKCAVFEGDSEYVYASYIIRLRLDLQRAIPKLISAVINSPIGRQYMFNERKQMTGQANVNSEKLKALPLRLPPLDEQQRIVAYLDGLQAKVDELKRLQAQTQEELNALMPSVLA